MHLYTQSASPNGQRVEVFMKEKGVELPMTQIDLRAGENLGDDFLAEREDQALVMRCLKLDDADTMLQRVRYMPTHFQHIAHAHRDKFCERIHGQAGICLFGEV